jgi:hypothetical protein
VGAQQHPQQQQQQWQQLAILVLCAASALPVSLQAAYQHNGKVPTCLSSSALPWLLPLRSALSAALAVAVVPCWE